MILFNPHSYCEWLNQWRSISDGCLLFYHRYHCHGRLWGRPPGYSFR